MDVVVEDQVLELGEPGGGAGPGGGGGDRLELEGRVGRRAEGHGTGVAPRAGPRRSSRGVGSGWLRAGHLVRFRCSEGVDFRVASE